MELQRGLKDGAKMSQGCFDGGLSNLQGKCCFMKVWRVLQGRLKSVFRVYQVFHRSLKGNSSKFQRWFSQVL